jgi:epoxide hydrolase 4
MTLRRTSMATVETGGLRHGYTEGGEVRLHYVEAGEGPLVVLLHGFPEFWFGWRFQISALAAAGLRVVAPDMRGYNLSARPAGVAAYHVDRLATDVRELIRDRGADRAFLAGHDWGAAVAWVTAMNHPEVVERLAILNVPHPRRMLHGLRRPRQLANPGTCSSSSCRGYPSA